MKGLDVLAVVADPDPAPDDLLEWLRLLVAIVATGGRLRLLAADVARLDPCGLPHDAASLVDGLADFDVEPEALDAAVLEATVQEADAVVRLGPADRAGEPTVLEIGPQTPAARALLAAGQVCVAAPRSAPRPE